MQNLFRILEKPFMESRSRKPHSVHPRHMPIIPGTGIAPGMAGMAGIVPGIPGIAMGIPIAGAMLGQLGIAGTCAVDYLSRGGLQGPLSLHFCC